MSYKSVWDFGRGGRSNYSVHGIGEYPTKIRPIIVHHVLDRFTQASDLVLDPFGGCGTTAVEAKLQGRNSISIDINRVGVSLTKKKLRGLTSKGMIKAYEELIADLESEMKGLPSTDRMGKIRIGKYTEKYKGAIKSIASGKFPATSHTVMQGDARRLDMRDNSIDSVITDIPYASMIRYSDERGDLSRITDYGDFKREIRSSMKEIVRVVKPGRYVVIFVADYRIAASRIILPIHSDVIQMMLAEGMELFDTYIWRYYRSGSFRPFGARPFQAMNLHTYILAFYKPAGSEDKKPNKEIHYRKRVLEKSRPGRRRQGGDTLLSYT